MHRKTLEELDYYRIRDEIAGYCAAEETKDNFLKKEPLTDSEAVEYAKSLSHQWEAVLTSSRNGNVKSWPSIHQFSKFLRVEDSSLDKLQLYSILQFCQSAQKCSLQINASSKSLQIKSLNELAEKIPLSQIQQVSNLISRIIDDDGNVKDLPALRQIRARISSIRTEIENALKRYTSDTTLNTVLESNVPAFRADRQVLAVKANMRNRINGIVHEVSQSGQTLYIEPEEVVRKNNELVQEEFHLQAEIRNILKNLTAEISPFQDDIKQSLFVMEKLDETCAVAKWGLEHHCTYAYPCQEEQSPLLLNARHPLLGEKAIPIDIKFMDGKNVLIITGPNTGGKTVTLKTFALFSMLNQTGFPVPAGDGTRLRIFEDIFADIGDEQSIDQSLSTFSAHMKNIAAAVKHAGNKSLVLLDELGSGTDPQEGGAIAMAVLDNLIEKKAFVLVTTHHGILKNYGYTNEYCVNASVEFDSTTLSPTYSLQMGIPGESHALDIAKRSGLPPETVKKARSFISTQQTDVSTLIKGLTKKHEYLIILEREFNQKAQKQNSKQLKLEQKELALKTLENELKEREHQNENAFLRETRKNLENLVRYLREGEITREKTLAVKQFITDLTGEIDTHELEIEEEKEQLLEAKKQLEESIENNETVILDNGMSVSKSSSKHSSNKKNTKKRLSNKEALKAATATYSDDQLKKLQKTKKTEKEIILSFEEGAEVLLSDGRTSGTLISRDSKNSWLVQVGSIRMSLKEKSLKLTAPSPQSKASYTVEFASNEKTDQQPAFELRLLGMREEEALKALVRQLDLCTMHNFKNFSVIHGKGNGILQQSVHDYLSNYPGVKDFHFAQPEDGGFGKTYVEMN